MRRIRTRGHLRADNKLYGHSWACFAAEALISAFGDEASATFYRDKENNEIDLVLDFRPVLDLVYAIEFKVAERTSVRPGFWRACSNVRPTHKLLVHSGSRSSHSRVIPVVSLLAAIKMVRADCGRR